MAWWFVFIDSFFFLKGEISIFAIWSKFARLKAKLTPRAQEIFSQSGKLDLRIYESVDGGIDTPNFFQCPENTIFAFWSKFARLRAQLTPRAQEIFFQSGKSGLRLYESVDGCIDPKKCPSQATLIFAIWSKFARLRAKLSPRTHEIFFPIKKVGSAPPGAASRS